MNCELMTDDSDGEMRDGLVSFPPIYVSRFQLYPLHLSDLVSCSI